jgi:hypothetical protein
MNDQPEHQTPFVIDTKNALRELQSARKELTKLRVALKSHNDECASMCGLGDQEGVACGYRNYFPRHCPECPKRNWTIDLEYIEHIGPSRSEP